MESIGTPAMWGGFLVFVTAMLVLDLGVFHRKTREVTVREAVAWSVVWVGLSVAFSGVIWLVADADHALYFLTAYVLEKSLSVDNIFVFILVFGGFAVPAAFQHRVLFWGILGAIFLRGAFILAGAALVARFEWVLYIFGVILLYTGGRMLFGSSEGDEGMDVEDHRVVRFFRRFVRMTPGYRGSQFWIRDEGKLYATPLLLVLVLIEVSDIIFAVDSVPTVLAVRVPPDPFIAFSSNICAILGLRAMFFVLAAVLPMFHLLEKGIAVVLLFVATKICLLVFGIHVPPALSLVVVLTVLTSSIVLSRLFPKKAEAKQATEDTAPPPDTSVPASPSDDGA